MITIIIYIQGRDLFQNWPSSLCCQEKDSNWTENTSTIVIYNEPTEQTSKLNLCHIFDTVIMLKLFNYINTNETPGELSLKNLIFSQLKISLYLHAAM